MSSASNLIQAAKEGNLLEVERILAENDTLANASDENGVTAVMWAAYHGHPEIAQRIVREKGGMSLFEAAILGDLDGVAAALQSGQAVDSLSADGFTALGFAAYFGHREVAGFLLEQGADPNQVSQNGLRAAPLHSALSGGHVDLAHDLLERGADPALAAGEGWVPLHYAADLGDAEMTAALLERGATPYVHNEAGQSPVDLAMDAGHEHIADLIRTIMFRKGQN